MARYEVMLNWSGYSRGDEVHSVESDSADEDDIQALCDKDTLLTRGVTKDMLRYEVESITLIEEEE